jgi:hypothetical protein
VATLRIKGGPELKARLASVIAAKPEITRAWGQGRLRPDQP